jgi:uncharacterized membrane protein
MKTIASLILAFGVITLAVAWALPAAGDPAAAPKPTPSGNPKPPTGGTDAVSPLGPNETAGKVPVLLVKGMWSQHWKLNDALATPEGRFGVSNSYVTQRYGYTFALKYFPEKRDELMAKRVVVLGNVPTTAFALKGPRSGMQPVAGRSDQWLVDFVEQGGGLLVMGGSFSFDLENTTVQTRNTFKDSALAKILPVELGDKGMKFEDQNRPLELKAAGEHPILKGLDFGDGKPITLFYHPMKARKDATVLLTADGAPILVVSTHGKGRVAVFLATLHGEVAKDLTPYWQWKSWPALVRNTVDWLAQ